ncbi:hypothetical protein ACRAWF_36310, partial [Streptomyces sp. L7]
MGIAWAGRKLFPADGPRTAHPAVRRDGARWPRPAASPSWSSCWCTPPKRAGPAPPALVSGGLSFTLLTCFAVVETRSRDPLVPARLFAHRGLVAAMAVTALYSATFSSLPYFLTLYFQTVLAATARVPRPASPSPRTTGRGDGDRRPGRRTRAVALIGVRAHAGPRHSPGRGRHSLLR